MTSTLGGRPTRPASMLDVARLAGVSQQTVSRVANDSDAVKPATRERVLAAMDELGYRPNSAARALKSGRFLSIGVLMRNLKSFGSSRMLEAINFEAARRGYSIDLISVNDPSTGEITQALTRLDHEAVDGIIMRLDRQDFREHAIDFPTRIPTVIVEGGAYDDRVSVDADQRQGTRLAVQHLLDLGHPTVWHVSGPEGYSSAAAREAEWRSALTDAGRDVPEVLRGDWSPESGYRAGMRLLEESQATAVYCANDQMALGLLRAFHEAGRAVPGDLSVVGFDDTQESEYFWPPLTTVRQDFAGVGASAVALLLEQIESGPIAPGLRLTPTQLIVRKSTDAWNG
ncbi:LacI family DNA-binding transcriptional regulator [Gryllotalpicola daejeonensis]|uniref:LacI family DNA-binding transcriptional regulator n=1 Tax=Gryllotalpicola daejeonensis TaxID=993087 RepID=A0ABP7ZJ84_9MICO